MMPRTRFKEIARAVRDFVLGASIFILATLALSADATDLGWTLEPVYRETGRQTAIVILGLVFSSIVVVNLWFFRHVRRVYVLSRRRRRRS
jgi:hypothetical protein